MPFFLSVIFKLQAKYDILKKERKLMEFFKKIFKRKEKKVVEQKETDSTKTVEKPTENTPSQNTK